ncbi:MAG TPA: hypothetical protein VMV75_03320 [Sulfuricella sp.]|nr:hypothetical protein [Sulfuricella sp.]
MTLLKPSLLLNTLVVFKDGQIVFEAAFHQGVNIIRGHNSSGKTTVLDFIAYTLGAEYIPWKQEALLCDYSVAEISLNGNRVTLRREVNDKPLNPLYIFWGPIADALEASFSSWEIYGFRRSSSKLSFTQALLLALDLPEAQGDGASNLTMHQFLRILYADQPSLHSPIFRTDSFDSALTRETVGSYLCGIYDDKLYLAQLEKRNLVKEIQQLEAELKSIFVVLAKSGQNANIELLGQEILNTEAKRDRKLKELARLKTERTVTSDAVATKTDANLRSELDVAKKTLAVAQDALVQRELEAEDSKNFVRELELRLSTLDESQITRNYFGSLAFAFCPCCLSEIKPESSNASECSLCKNQITSSVADAQILRMRNELRIQLAESNSLIALRLVEIRDLRTRIPSLRQNLMLLERRYAETTHSWSTDIEAAIELNATEIGGLDQEIKGLYESQRLAQVIRELQSQRDDLVYRESEVSSKIESLMFTQEERKKQTACEVALTLGRLLQEDLHRQEEFRKAENIQFSFTDNAISVDGATQFSESSTVVLRHLFHLALLSASTRMQAMRFPRFLMLDGIEDGGMELARSHRLQEIIVNECSGFDCEYQLIFATSQIAPQLDVEDFVVARSFSEEQRSLQIL